MCETLIDQDLAKRPSTAPRQAQVAAIIVGVPEAVPDKVEVALIDQHQQAIGGSFAKRALGRATRIGKFGGVDPDQTHPAITKAQRVAVDDA